MKNTIFVIVVIILLFVGSAEAQRPQGQTSDVEIKAPWALPDYASAGKAASRHEFISFDERRLAESGDREKANHYLPLIGEWRINYSTTSEGGTTGFYKPSYSVASWGTEDIPNLGLAAGSSGLSGLVPSSLPNENPLVQYRAEIDIPYLWLDRDLYIHIEGVGGAYSLFVNDKRVGYNEDSRTPVEFNISDAVTNGLNSIGIEVYGYATGSWLETSLPPLSPGSLGLIYLHSQPKLCIGDFVITTRPDTAGKHILADIAVVMSNSYNGPEPITFGYDIYGPDGKLVTYNRLETNVPSRSTDTLHFREYLYGAFDKIAWSPETPNQYRLMLITQRDGRITEYIPLKLGIKWVDLDGEDLLVNGKKVDLRTVNYNASSDKAQTEKQLQTLKKEKFNTIAVGYPQSAWFYELCDRIGFYVIDQANINADYRPENRNVGGTLANRPECLTAFMDRTIAMQGRTRNYVCVLALNMGGESGNGYNFYKTYQWLKANDTIHPVTYRHVQGEWNSDFAFPIAGNAREFLEQSAR